MYDYRSHTLGSVVALMACCVLGCLCGCVNTGARVSAYDISVQLDPAEHVLCGLTAVTLERTAGLGPLEVDFALNRALQVEEVACTGAELKGHAVQPIESDDGSDEAPLLAIHRVVLGGVGKQCTLTFRYKGTLVQDVQAGEKPGQIHNLEMAAHIGTDGVYLEPSGGWYPSLYHDPEEPPRGELADYSLTVDPVEGLALVAGAALDAAATKQTGRLVWHSKYPLDGLVLVGGNHQIKTSNTGGRRLALHYARPDDPKARQLMERNTGIFLNAAAGYLDRYEPLIGPYPFDTFTIVENFFSSGFAFPEFTLLDRRLIQMGPRALRHGMLDHEILHAWWGNSIYVDPADGNWCEAITSYAANHYGYILDGKDAGARKYRRNACAMFSLLEPEDDRPLGTFGRENGAGRGIGYQKGAVVFHMVARKIGQDNFWAAMRRLSAEYTGKYANWGTFQALFEQQGGVRLERFFRQWVREAGAPSLSLRSATWSDADSTLTVALDQGATAFELAVPLRLVRDDGTHEDVVVEIDKTSAKVRVPLDAAPKSVILDPDFHVFRRLQPSETLPTTATTLAGDKLLIVEPAGELSPFYQTVIERFSSGKAPGNVTRTGGADVAADALASQSILVLGEAVRDARVQALLARTDCPIVWNESGFQIDGQSYNQPGQSVLCTVHHPDDPGRGITLYYGNSEDALGRSDLLLFYRNSLVVFETSASVADGEKTYKSDVAARRDFEALQTLDVVR